MPIAAPTLSSSSIVRRRSSSSERPGIASSLSAVPPVCPRPRPVSITTGRSNAASSGASTRDTLSPTPPVECLSQTCGTASASRHCSPDSSIARVSSIISAPSSPRVTAAIRKAASCASLQLPSVAPATIAAICSRDSLPPSRLVVRIG